MLIVGETVLVGSDEIPRELPALVEAGLARGGVDWPGIPGLVERLASARGAPAGGLDVRQNLARDPLGNALAIAVLVGMLGVGARVVVSWRRPDPGLAPARRERAIPVLAVAGLAIAAYLTVVEVTQTRAFCGPVGDCNAVQQSAWARLFGIVPVGLLGLAGYVVVLAAWVVGRRARAPLRDWADAALFALAALGTLFSIYLTVLEPFVIGAVCAWCLASAGLMVALFWASAAPGRRALGRLRSGSGAPSGGRARRSEG